MLWMNDRALGRGRPAWVGLLALTVVVLFAGCDPGGVGLMEVSGPTMGTYYSVKLAGPPAGITEDALRRGVEGVLDEVIALISTYDPASELSRLNANPSTDWVAVSPQLLAVMREGQVVSEQSEGAFDITVGPLVNLWGFGPKVKAEGVPSAEAIAQARGRVGYKKLELRPEPPAIRRERGDMYIDLSALGEGYGADRVAAYLDAQGVQNYMVAVAGAIRVKGRNAKGSPWAIAVEEPTPGRRSVYRILEITGEGLSTSGDYRNFFVEGGRRYSHAIDPKTGSPIRHSLASVTVVAEDAMGADGLATALLVMGEERGPALADALGLKAFFIIREDKGFREHATVAFRGLLAQ